VDMSSAPDGVSIKNVVQVIADTKTELILRSASKEQFRTLERELFELK
jgi:hypothetical protein